MGFYDESGVFKTKTAEEERAEQAARFKDAGKKIFILFWMNIGSIITSVFVFLGAAILGVIDALGVSGAKGMLYLFIVLIVIGGIAFSIAYGAILLSMGKYNDRMRTAGICYLVYEVLSILQNYLFSDNWIGSIMKLVSIILAVIYLFSFT